MHDSREEERIDEKANALEALQTGIDARIDALEHDMNSSSSGSRKGNEQNPVRAEATGFAVSFTEEDVRGFLQEVIEKTCDGRLA